jgi:hypothetical protein
LLLGRRRKKSEKVDWMYAGTMGAANRDEYLLGKPVDRSLLLNSDKPDDALTV